MAYWKGGLITELAEDEIFVFGSNPEGRHGAGSAKAALAFGAVYGVGRGLSGQTYALVTVNLKAGYTEPNGTCYLKAGPKSVSLVHIVKNLRELKSVAKTCPEKKFLVAYTYGDYNRNGYSDNEMAMAFVAAKLPDNVLLHESFEEEINKILERRSRWLASNQTKI